jgi:hypothetical protein
MQWATKLSPERAVERALLSPVTREKDYTALQEALCVLFTTSKPLPSIHNITQT